MDSDVKSDAFLLALISDRIGQCADRYCVTSSSFLDLRQRSLAQNFCKKQKGVSFCFFGGYEDAERRVCIFLPDYISLEDSECGTVEYFYDNPDYSPLSFLRLSKKDGSPTLTHRDYLGALMGTGIKRETVGDILVREDGADIIVLGEVKDYLLTNFDKAGRASLSLSEICARELIVPSCMISEKRDTVASLRLDSIVASAYSLSRSRAATEIERGAVYLNGVQTIKPDCRVDGGDKIVLRGKGKCVLKEIGAKSKKDRIFITLDCYK